jgi:methyl-accepting chemotaxis protein
MSSTRAELDRVLAVLAACKGGDLTSRCGPPYAEGDLGVLAQGLDEALAAIAHTLGPLDTRVGELGRTAERLDRSARSLATSAARQAAAVSEIARRLQALSARSDEVGQIVELLDDVAAETNILALNAAIEASRAGTQGKGFGMVADEVRKLAERSAAATKDIGAFVQAIEGTASESARAVDGVRGLSEDITAAAAETGQAVAQLAGAAQLAGQTMARFRLPGHREADLLLALSERRADLDRALSGLHPLIENPEIARTPVGEALRRLLSALATIDGQSSSRTEPHAG